MNNEEQNKDERFTLVELANGGFAVYDEEDPGHPETCIFWQIGHPYARKAAEAERDRLNAWNRDSGTILPVEYLPKPRRVPTVFGTFSAPPPHTLTVAEKRRYLAEIFRSPDFTDCDKFKALQEDNRMLAMFGIGNGKEQSRKEIVEKERELRSEIIETEKEIKKVFRSWFESLFQTRKEQSHD